MNIRCSYILLLISGFLCACSNYKSTVNLEFQPDTLTMYRNPLCGLAIYEYGHSFFPKEEQSYDAWNIFDSVDATKYANILYIRVPYDLMEPEEGKYAWKYNKEYIAFINKALSRGLKLGFRVFFDNCVPDWVYKAGAHSTLEPPLCRQGDKLPYFDDPIFLEKLDNFIRAFGEEYNDPDKTDFIDAYGLGRWGEGHGVVLKDSANLKKVIERVTESYAKNFDKVITAITLSSADWYLTKPLAFDKLGFIPRRDGIGSHWFHDAEREALKQLFPEKAFVAEGCYFLDVDDTYHYDISKRRKLTKDFTFTVDTACNEKNDFWHDKRFKMRSYSEMFRVELEDALINHANVFNLRAPHECEFWIKYLPNEVQRFITLGGYRLYPSQISIKQKGNHFKISHSWNNYGVGVLPNKHPNWNEKYKVSFALLEAESKEVVETYVVPDVDPSDWLKGNTTVYETSFNLGSQSGKYILCVGITDLTKEDLPSIEIAVGSQFKIGKWVKLLDISL